MSRWSFALCNRRAQRRAAVAFGLSALVVPLAACGPMHPGAAATIGDTRITVSQLHKTVDLQVSDPGIAALGTPDLAKIDRASLSTLIQRRLFAEGARLKGVSVSEGEVAAALTKLKQGEGSAATLATDAARNGVALADLHDFLYNQLLSSKLAAKLAAGQTDQAAVAKAFRTFLDSVVKQEPISINPRYGTWDASQFIVVDRGNAISSLVPTPSAPGSPSPSPSA